MKRLTLKNFNNLPEIKQRQQEELRLRELAIKKQKAIEYAK
jgi:hypothetical protein